LPQGRSPEAYARELGRMDARRILAAGVPMPTPQRPARAEAGPWDLHAERSQGS